MSLMSREVKDAAPWGVLVMDDEPDVLAVTELALEGLVVDGRSIRLDFCESREQALHLLREHSYAVAILDVVLRHEQTGGLELVKMIRGMENQRSIQIVLRTGQPGVAPEQEVVREYPVNDYWPKTEISIDRMRTVLTGLIRSHETQQRMDWERKLFDHSYQTLAREGVSQLSGQGESYLQSLCDLVRNATEKPIGLLLVEAKTSGLAFEEESDRELSQRWLTLPLECLEDKLRSSVKSEWKQADLQQLMIEGQMTPSFVLVLGGEDGANPKWQMVPLDWMKPDALEVVQKKWWEYDLKELLGSPTDELAVFTREGTLGSRTLYLLVWTPAGREEDKSAIFHRFFDDILSVQLASEVDDSSNEWDLTIS